MTVFLVPIKKNRIGLISQNPSSLSIPGRCLITFFGCATPGNGGNFRFKKSDNQLFVLNSFYFISCLVDVLAIALFFICLPKHCFLQRWSRKNNFSSVQSFLFFKAFHLFF